MKDTLPETTSYQHVPACAVLKGNSFSKPIFFMQREEFDHLWLHPFVSRVSQENRIGLRGLELLLQALPKVRSAEGDAECPNEDSCFVKDL